MSDILKHIINEETLVISALDKLNTLASDAILFIVNSDNELVGSLTDGDIRRGLLRGLKIDESVASFIQPKPAFLIYDHLEINKINDFRKLGYKIIPILDYKNNIIDILNFRIKKSYLPINVLIMAGGRGLRLMPLTEFTPKPLLVVGEKPILHLLIDHLISYGVKNITISVNYLRDKIVDYINMQNFDVKIDFIFENQPLGTIGSASCVNFEESITTLVVNSDILTNLKLDDFVLDYIEKRADISVFTIPYSTEIPYGVVETKDCEVVSLFEKPVITKDINSGVYLLNSNFFKVIPNDTFYNMTDLINECLYKKNKIVSYSSSDYWLDIGRIEDFQKAQHDVKTVFR